MKGFFSITIAFCFCMILSNHSASQSTFLKTLGTSGNETGQLIFLEDNTPIIIGTTDSTGNGDLFVSKLPSTRFGVFHSVIPQMKVCQISSSPPTETIFCQVEGMAVM